MIMAGKRPHFLNVWLSPIVGPIHVSASWIVNVPAPCEHFKLPDASQATLQTAPQIVLQTARHTDPSTVSQSSCQTAFYITPETAPKTAPQATPQTVSQTALPSHNGSHDSCPNCGPSLRPSRKKFNLNLARMWPDPCPESGPSLQPQRHFHVAFLYIFAETKRQPWAAFWTYVWPHCGQTFYPMF